MMPFLTTLLMWRTSFELQSGIPLTYFYDKVPQRRLKFCGVKYSLLCMHSKFTLRMFLLFLTKCKSRLINNDIICTACLNTCGQASDTAPSSYNILQYLIVIVLAGNAIICVRHAHAVTAYAM